MRFRFIDTLDSISGSGRNPLGLFLIARAPTQAANYIGDRMPSPGLYPHPSYVTVDSTVRFRSKPLVALTILLTLVGAMGGWHAPDDRDDDAVQLVHHHSQHNERFTTAADPAPEHCAFCHFLRTFGNGKPASVQAVARASQNVSRLFAVPEHVYDSALLVLPSRAPPVG
jgi:hypothetical protein